MRVQFTHSYDEIISVENLLLAWQEFVRDKRGKRDVQIFQLRLMDNILALHADLRNHTYKHGSYKHFRISDPKPRDIHKANVRDRLLHHAIYRKLYPFFDRTFIADSFSCRIGKGTHRALNRFRLFAGKASRNHTRTCFALKCDIRKFFANIDHEILFSILTKYIQDKDIIWLIENVVGSFSSGRSGIGLPLGNLTSQLLVNIYMNEFDQFVKHRLKAKYYIRYADDFAVFSSDGDWLAGIVRYIVLFLSEKLRLQIHPDKVFIKTVASGVDFLGWVNFLNHRVLRTATKRRILRKLALGAKSEKVNSYLGLLKHGNTWTIKQKIAGMINSSHELPQNSFA